MAMTEVFVANGPQEAEVFGVYEDLVAGCEVYLVFVEGYAAQSPRTASSFPAYRWVVVTYDLLDRFGVQVYYVDTSVVLALMGGAHYGACDYFWEPFHAILCSVFVRQRIIHTRPERRAVFEARFYLSRGSLLTPRRTSGCRSGRRTLPVGTSLIAQLHQQRAQNLPHRPLVFGRKLLPPASDLPLPERPSHPEEPFLNQSHRCLLHLHPKVPGHPLYRQPLGYGAPPSLSSHQVLKLDHRSPSVSLPPQELPVALIERLKLTSAKVSAPDGDQQPLAVRG